MAGDTAETETGIAVPVPDENGDTPSKSADNSHDASGLSPRDDTILEDDEQDPDTTPPAGGGLSEDAIALKQELAKITVEPPTKIMYVFYCASVYTRTRTYTGCQALYIGPW